MEVGVGVVLAAFGLPDRESVAIPPALPRANGRAVKAGPWGAIEPERVGKGR